MIIISHRGKGFNDLENTKAGIFNALNSKYANGVEFDVRMTKDKQFVLSHDDSLERVFHVNKRISKMTLEECLNIEPRVPTLESILNEVKNNKLLLVEMKVGKCYKTYVKNFYKIISKYSNLNIKVISFNLKALKYISKLDSNLDLVYLSRELPRTLPSFSAISLNYKYLNSTIIDRIEKEGRQLLMWTVKDINDIDHLPIPNNTVITTNDPLLIYEQITRE